MLSEPFDPVLGYFAKKSGIPMKEYSPQVVGEGTGVALEKVTDVFTTGWFNYTVKGATALIAALYAMYGKKVPDRLVRELMAIYNHLGFEVVADLIEKGAIEIPASIGITFAAMRTGNVNAVLASLVRSPAEVQARLGIRRTITRVPPRSMPPRAPAVAPPGRIDIEAPPAVGQGRYQIMR